MRKIDSIIIHCSATKAGKDFRAKDIDRWHREQGFQMIGYNFVIDLDGTVEVGRPTSMTGAHCKGWNARSIGICYIGGLDAAGRPADTRTRAQKEALHRVVRNLLESYPSIVYILGHRDISPDKNKDGKITPDEWIKACPCFDVRTEFPVSYCEAKRR